jgi:MOSC domain-containing protein YiiM
MAKVLRLFRVAKKRAPMEELVEALVMAQAGSDGYAHVRNGKRQVLLADGETLRAMDLQPGIIRENITTEGLDVNALKVGARLSTGRVVLEVGAVTRHSIPRRPASSPMNPARISSISSQGSQKRD